jgi:hypothetical protein
MSRRTRSKYEHAQRVASLLSLVAFLAFLMVPLRFAPLTYALLAAALVFLLAAGIIKVLVIKGIPLNNDLKQVSEEAGQGRQ